MHTNIKNELLLILIVFLNGTYIILMKIFLSDYNKEENSIDLM